MRLHKAIELMTQQTTGFGSVGRATGDKLSAADAAFVCRSIQADAWNAARLNLGQDHRGIHTLMESGYKYAHRANQQDKWGFDDGKLWKLTGIALAEIASPQRVWVTHYSITHDKDGNPLERGEEMRSVKWTQELRAGLYGIKLRQWVNAYSRPCNSIYCYFDGLLGDASRQVSKNESSK